jgi:ER-bound oxygenase mpaB/B'/Rubber oxygenase, catalytic domain
LLLQLAEPMGCRRRSKPFSNLPHVQGHVHDGLRYDRSSIGAARRLHRRHAAITGAMPIAAGRFAAGPRYWANETTALRWVHATLIETALLARGLVLPKFQTRTGRGILGFPDRPGIGAAYPGGTERLPQECCRTGCGPNSDFPMAKPNSGSPNLRLHPSGAFMPPCQSGCARWVPTRRPWPGYRDARDLGRGFPSSRLCARIPPRRIFHMHQASKDCKIL